MKTFIITTVIKCSDEVEAVKPGVNMIYRYLNSVRKAGVIKKKTYRGKVLIEVLDVENQVIEV